MFEPGQTRNRKMPNVKKHSNRNYNLSYLSKAPATWLALSDELKNKPTIRGFTKMYKKIYL